MGFLDFVSGAAATGAQIGMDQIKSMVEEDRAKALALFNHDLALKRDQSQSQLRIGEHEANSRVDQARETALIGVRGDKEVDVANRKPQTVAEGSTLIRPGQPDFTPPKTPTPETPAREDYYKAGADNLRAESERRRAETEAIRDGTKYSRGGNGARADSAALERNVRTATNGLQAMLGRERGEDGKPVYDAETIGQYKQIAGALVRGGMSPEEAQNAALGVRILGKAEINAEVEKRFAAAAKVGMIRGALTGNNVESGDVEVAGGKTMKPDEWKNAERVKLMDENRKAVADFLAENGIGGGRPSGPVGVDPDAVKARIGELQKKGTPDAEIRAALDKELGAGSADRFMPKAQEKPAEKSSGLINSPLPSYVTSARRAEMRDAELNAGRERMQHR